MVCDDRFRHKLTDVESAGLFAQAQQHAHRLGVGLLHQQVNDGLAVGLDQVLTLGREGLGQHRAHLLHSGNHFRLPETQEVVWFRNKLYSLKFLVINTTHKNKKKKHTGFVTVFWKLNNVFIVVGHEARSQLIGTWQFTENENCE